MPGPTAFAQKGLSMIEIMLALVLSLILLTGVSQIYVSSSNTYRLEEELSRIQENARFAQFYLARDVREADYRGCRRFITVQNNLDPSGTGYDASIHNFDDGIEGTDGTTDTLILKSAVPSDPPITVQPPYGPQPSSQVGISAGNNLQQGEIVFLSDCEAGDIFQITNNNPGSGSLVHNTGQGDPGNYNPASGNCTSGHCLSKVYYGDAEVMRLQTITYTIQNDPNNDPDGDGVGEPTLYRDGEPLVPGVENMQLEYGVDTTNDREADQYVTATAVGDWNDVVAVRAHLLLRSMDDGVLDQAQTYRYNGANVTAGDTRLRTVVTTTITMRNRAL